jgi:hypothetical protein
MVRICVLACAIHFLLGGGDKQPAELLADEDWNTPQLRRRADGRNDRFWREAAIRGLV